MHDNYHIAFNQDNAKNTQRDELACSFVIGDSFIRCLCPKHQFIFGTRGSGKTAIARMISHDHLRLLQDSTAKACVERADFIGVYVNTSLGFVSSMKHKPWTTDEELERGFTWRFNLTSCIALTHSIESCLLQYFDSAAERAVAESETALFLSRDLFSSGPQTSLNSLRRDLETLVLKREQRIARARYIDDDVGVMPGAEFDVELLLPFITAANWFADKYLPNGAATCWVVSIDEAEFLSQAPRRMINTIIRSRLPNLFIKVITLPYEYTLETNIDDCNLDLENDVDFVFLDEAYISTEDVSLTSELSESIFVKRFEMQFPEKDLSIRKVLGVSTILGKKNMADLWAESGKMWKLLDKYATKKVRDRADILRGEPAFFDQIARKITGILLLIDSIKGSKGKSRNKEYSGFEMIIRCSDGNPRRLIRLYKEIMLAISDELNAGNHGVQLDQVRQADIIRTVGQSLLDRVISEPRIGVEMDKLLRSIGCFVNASLLKPKMSTDIYSGVSIDLSSEGVRSRAARKLMAIGCLYPQMSPNRPTKMPDGKVVMRLAYVFAPVFNFFPRKGKHKNIERIEDLMKELVEDVDQLNWLDDND